MFSCYEYIVRNKFKVFKSFVVSGFLCMYLG